MHKAQVQAQEMESIAPFCLLLLLLLHFEDVIRPIYQRHQEEE
jgi:hypothetical protein